MPSLSPSGQPPRTTTTYALLGLLSLRSWTTYELAKQVRRSLNWFWPRAERQLYDEPKRLVAAGLATASQERTGLRPRTVYAITKDGRKALRGWLDEPAAPRSGEFEAMLKVFFADAGTLGQLERNLSAIEQEATERLAALAAMTSQVRGGQSEFPHRQHLSALAVRLHVDQEETVIRWARWAREQLAAWKAAGDPGDWDYRAVMDELIDRGR